MKLSKEQYQDIYQKHSGKSNLVKDCIIAFAVGGIICTVAEILKNLFIMWGMPEKDALTALPIVMVFIGIFLTFIGVYQKLAKKAGAGTLVPITGFANAVSSPAMEFKSEGLITGTAVKMFSIAGPVIVYGTTAAIIYGIFVYLIEVVLW